MRWNVNLRKREHLAECSNNEETNKNSVGETILISKIGLMRKLFEKVINDNTDMQESNG
jgi:hypothetical protein